MRAFPVAVDGEASELPLGPRLGWMILAFVFPVLVICYARWLFNEIIEPQKINFEFFAVNGSPFVLEQRQDGAIMPFIPASVIELLYSLGFALSVSVTLAGALAVYSFWQVIRHAKQEPRFAVLYVVFCLVAVALTYVAANAGTSPEAQVTATSTHNTEQATPAERDKKNAGPREKLRAALTGTLIKQTLGLLPTCDDGKCESGGIGNTGKSLLQVVRFAFAFIAIAGVGYSLAAVAIVGDRADPAQSKSRLATLTYLAGTTFVATVLATHLLFQPGLKMIGEVYDARIVQVEAESLEHKATPPTNPGLTAASVSAVEASRERREAAEDFDVAKNRILAAKKSSENSYTSLSSSMTLYWAIIFSLALGSTFFTASAAIDSLAGSSPNFNGVADFVKKVIAIISPVALSTLLQIGEAFVKSSS